MRLRRLLALLGLLAATAPFLAMAETAPSEVRRHIDQAALRGMAEFRALGQRLYTAELFTPNGHALDWSRGAALSLTYSRNFPAGVLVWASMAELDRLEGPQSDHESLRQGLEGCFTTVGKGDRYLALARDADHLEFWLNGVHVCTLTGRRWAERYLSIWLSDQSRAPHLSKALIGGETG